MKIPLIISITNTPASVEALSILGFKNAGDSLKQLDDYPAGYVIAYHLMYHSLVIAISNEGTHDESLRLLVAYHWLGITPYQAYLSQFEEVIPWI